jgi:DNA-binding transcriptional ArsR family regulator
VPDAIKVLADPTRRQIIRLLRGGDMTAGELAGHFDLSWPTVSGHLKLLKEADLVQADRHGTSITYHLNLSVLEAVLASLMSALGVGEEGETG